MKLRLALCSPGEVWGGVEQFVLSMAQYLRDRDVEVLGVVFNDGILRERLQQARIPVLPLPAHSRYDPSMIARLRAGLNEHGINVLHSHGYKAAVLGGMAARLNRIGHVRTEHGQVEPWTGLARLKMHANALFERAATATLTDAVVYVSEDIRGRSRRGPRPPLQQVIYNGIEQPPASRIETRDRLPNDGTFKIGIVGRVSPVKGHHYFLQAAAQLQHLTDVRYYVIGSGPLEAECQEFCAAQGLDTVSFLGFKQNIHAYLRQLDLLIIPSLHEGLPYTLLEAMYHKLPIVASRVGGLKEVIEDGVSGLLVKAGDVPALAAAIERVVQDQGLRQRLAANAHRTVCDRFLIDHMGTQYLDVYRRLLRDDPHVGHLAGR
jgi:glycosyltransferase involved in cell wall biosynthesis